MRRFCSLAAQIARLLGLRDAYRQQGASHAYTAIAANEAERQASEQLYRTWIEAIPHLVWVAEADGVTRIDCNHRWYDFTGQSPDEGMGDRWLTIVHPDDVEAVLHEWERAIAHTTPYEATYRLRRADGVFVRHLVKAEPEYDPQGNVLRWYGTCTEIGDRHYLQVEHLCANQLHANQLHAEHPHAEHSQAEATFSPSPQTLNLQVSDRTAEVAATNQELIQEIDERAQAEEQLRASEERFRRAIRDAPFPIIIHAEDGRIIQMSQALLDITGYSETEIQTLNDWVEYAYSEQKLDTLEQINRLYSLDERLNEGEFTVRTKANALRTWLFSSAPLGQLMDGTRLVISMAADVTDQKRTEAALATRLKQQAVMTQLSQRALLGLDLDSLFQQTTRLLSNSLDVEYAKVLRLSSDQQSFVLQAGVGWQSGLVGHATVPAERHSQAGYTLMSQEPVVVEDLQTETRFHGPPLLTQHGIVSGMSTIIQGKGDRPFGVLGAHSSEPRAFTQDDVNFLQAIANVLAAAIYRKQSEYELQKLNQTLEQRVRDRTQALEEVNRELEAFSYSVAHDLRAPLRAIQGFAQVLAEDYDTALDDLGKEYIHRMGSSAEHLDVLVEDLLAYSRLGRTEIRLQPVNTAKIIHDIIDDRESAIATKNAQVTVAPHLPTVYAQRSILRQVFSNLIDNSLKFAAPDKVPQISIGSTVKNTSMKGESPYPSWVRLWVEDHGIGIASHHQDRIFKAFERLHGVESYAGTGIGLAIVKRGIERLGGRVGVDSTLNQGSRFWIELPLAYRQND
ncbi:MAG: PAS domain S-box protein [Leptolyngbyaceae bacterium]|nr:PAS domain S-box protein [Leptolyngbyaceae bacterium]